MDGELLHSAPRPLPDGAYQRTETGGPWWEAGLRRVRCCLTRDGFAPCGSTASLILTLALHAW